MQTADMPFKGALALSPATSDRPNTQMANSSGEPIRSTSGRRIGTEMPSTKAPNSPPSTEAV